MDEREIKGRAQNLHTTLIDPTKVECRVTYLIRGYFHNEVSTTPTSKEKKSNR
ncbi:MAG: hypothetical protein IPH74_15620 [Bacteroidetes bacterium]|nr:hypothetical protein [Bacteroidota bacterium]